MFWSQWKEIRISKVAFIITETRLFLLFSSHCNPKQKVILHIRNFRKDTVKAILSWVNQGDWTEQEGLEKQ